jgi:hypothetical protein
LSLLGLAEYLGDIFAETFFFIQQCCESSITRIVRAFPPEIFDRSDRWKIRVECSSDALEDMKILPVVEFHPESGKSFPFLYRCLRCLERVRYVHVLAAGKMTGWR